MSKYRQPDASVQDAMDDVLSLLPLVASVPSLHGRVFDRLVDCLVDAVLEDVHTSHESGETSREEYLEELAQIVEAMNSHGLLGFESRR